MSGRVIVVGSVNVDLVVAAPRLPRPGETVTGGAFARHHGGKGANQAVAAARLGAPTAFVGALGPDESGAEARAALAAEGIDAEGLSVVSGAATGVALIVVDTAGENLIAVASGANADLATGDVMTALDRLAVAAGDVVLVGHEIPTAATRAALAAARARGATTILNPAPAGGLDASCMALVDVLTPNRGELAELAFEGDPVAAATSLTEPAGGRRGPRAVLVTLGERGAVLVRHARPRLDIPAPRVHAVDATGAGDALNGALAAALARGADLEAASREAVVAAACSTTRPGARGGLLTRRELEAVLSESPNRIP